VSSRIEGDGPPGRNPLKGGAGGKIGDRRGRCYGAHAPDLEITPTRRKIPRRKFPGTAMFRALRRCCKSACGGSDRMEASRMARGEFELRVVLSPADWASAIRWCSRLAASVGTSR
jgi:hypothetical protein